MAAISNVPQLVDKKRGSYSTVAPRLEPGKFNKQKKYDIMESVISCETTKSIWTGLVHSFEGLLKDFQKNSDDEADERSSEEYLRDIELEFHKRALLANSKLPNSSLMLKVFQPKFTPKLIQSSQHAQSSQSEPKFQKDYKNKGLVAETFDWDEEEVSHDEEMTQVKVLMALTDNELSVGKNHAHNGEWIDITMKKSHASPSYSHSTQPYYVTHPSSVIDYEEDYQGELQGDAQEDKLRIAMMLLARSITQRFYTPINNRLRTSSNTRNQTVIQDGRVDIQSKNVSYVVNGNRNVGRQNRNQAANMRNGKANVQCYNCNAKGHYARNCAKPKVRDAKYFKEQMLLAMKDEARGNINEEENDFMLDNDYGDDTLEELSVVVIMMARIQPAEDNADTKPKYDAKAINEVNASQIDLISEMLSKGIYKHTNHEKLKTVINTSADDQIISNIIFGEPCMENNGGIDEHNSNAHDQSFEIESLIYNVKKEAKNQQRMNNDLKMQKALLQKKLETYKERVKTLEIKRVQFSNYKEAYGELEHEIRVDKDMIERILKEKDKISSRATEEYMEYMKVFVGVDVPTIQPQPVESTQGTIRTPSAHRTPTPTAIAQKKKQKQENLMEEDIEKMVDDAEEESYASEFADSVFLNKEVDSDTRIEPRSHKENPKVVDDDDVDDNVDQEKKDDEKKDDDNDDNDNDDHTEHTLVGTQVTGSLETRKEKM
ncbi:retrovirus-related pol polyprotein from transposon TNT 1-94 [Tanacetum coccineum]